MHRSCAASTSGPSSKPVSLIAIAWHSVESVDFRPGELREELDGKLTIDEYTPIITTSSKSPITPKHPMRQPCRTFFPLSISARLVHGFSAPHDGQCLASRATGCSHARHLIKFSLTAADGTSGTLEASGAGGGGDASSGSAGVGSDGGVTGSPERNWRSLSLSASRSSGVRLIPFEGRARRLRRSTFSRMQDPPATRARPRVQAGFFRAGPCYGDSR